MIKLYGEVILICYYDFIKKILIIDELLLLTNWLVSINYEIINVT